MLKELEIKKIRNISDFHEKFDKNILIFHGPNGSGKTTILESLFLLSSGKSFRTNDWKEVLNTESNITYLAAKYEERNIGNKIQLNLSNQKQIKLNDENSTFKEVLGIVHPTILDQRIVNDFKHTKKVRLNLFDRLITTDKKVFNSLLKEFKTVSTSLRQAKKNVKLDKTFITVIAEKLSEIEIQIMQYRKQFEKKIEDIFITNCQRYLNEEVRIKYSPIKTPETALNELLQHSTTTVAQDDWVVYKGQDNYIKYASEGQVRMILLVFIVSYLEMIKKEYDQEFPLLLDDVFNELDDDNINLFLKILEDKSINAMITTQRIENIENKSRIQEIKL